MFQSFRKALWQHTLRLVCEEHVCTGVASECQSIAVAAAGLVGRGDRLRKVFAEFWRCKNACCGWKKGIRCIHPIGAYATRLLGICTEKYFIILTTTVHTTWYWSAYAPILFFIRRTDRHVHRIYVCTELQGLVSLCTEKKQLLTQVLELCLPSVTRAKIRSRGGNCTNTQVKHRINTSSEDVISPLDTHTRQRAFVKKGQTSETFQLACVFQRFGFVVHACVKLIWNAANCFLACHM